MISWSHAHLYTVPGLIIQLEIDFFFFFHFYLCMRTSKVKKKNEGA